MRTASLPPLIEDLTWLAAIADERLPQTLSFGEEPGVYVGRQVTTHWSVSVRRSLAIRSEEAIFKGRRDRNAWREFVTRERNDRLGFSPPTRFDWTPVRRRLTRYIDDDDLTPHAVDEHLIAVWHSPEMARVWDDLLRDAS